MTTRQMAISSLIVTSFIWGVSIPITKFVLLMGIPPFSSAFLRFSIASLVAAFFVEFKGIRFHDVLQIGIFALFGVTLSLGLYLIGLNNVQAVDASLIIALSPVITVVMAVIILQEKISTIHKAGIILALVGTLLYLARPILFDGGLKINLFSDLLIILSQVAAAIYAIGTKKLFIIYKSTQITAVSFLVGAVSFIPGTVFEYTVNPDWVKNLNFTTLTAILFLGVFVSFIAYTTMEWGLSKVDVYIQAITSYLIPVFGVVTAVIFLKEKLNSLFIISALFISAGVYLVSYKRKVQHHPFHKA